MWGVSGIISWMLHLSYGGRIGGFALLSVLVHPFFVSSAWTEEDLKRAVDENPLGKEYIDADCGDNIACLMEGIYPVQHKDSLTHTRECALNSVLWGERYVCDEDYWSEQLYFNGQKKQTRRVQRASTNSSEITKSGSGSRGCPPRLEFQLMQGENQGEILINEGLFCSEPPPSDNKKQPPKAYRYVKMVHCWQGNCTFTHPVTGDERSIHNRYPTQPLIGIMHPRVQALSLDIFDAQPLTDFVDFIQEPEVAETYKNALGTIRLKLTHYEAWAGKRNYYFGYKFKDKRPQVGVFVSDHGEGDCFNVAMTELPTSPSDYPELFIRVTDILSVSSYSVFKSKAHMCDSSIYFSVFRELSYCYQKKRPTSAAVTHSVLLKDSGIKVTGFPYTHDESGWISYGATGEWQNTDKDGNLVYEYNEYNESLKGKPCQMLFRDYFINIAKSEFCFKFFPPHYNVSFWNDGLKPLVDGFKSDSMKGQPLVFGGTWELEESDSYPLRPLGIKKFQPPYKSPYYSHPTLISARLQLGEVQYPVQFFTRSRIVKKALVLSFRNTGKIQVDNDRGEEPSMTFQIHKHAIRNTIYEKYYTRKKEPGPLLCKGDTFTTASFGPLPRIVDCTVRVTGFHIILIDTHERMPFDINFFVNAVLNESFESTQNADLQWFNRYVQVLRPDWACATYWKSLCDHESFEWFLVVKLELSRFLNKVTQLSPSDDTVVVEEQYKNLLAGIKTGKQIFQSTLPRYKLSSLDVCRENLRHRFNLATPDYQDQVAMRDICDMVTLNNRTEEKYFYMERSQEFEFLGSFDSSARRTPFRITQLAYRTVATRGIDGGALPFLTGYSILRDFGVLRVFFPKSAAEVVDALDAYVALSTLPTIEEHDFQRLIETLKLMRVLLPPYKVLDKETRVIIPSEDKIKAMQGQLATMGGILLNLSHTESNSFDSLTYTPAFVEFQKNLATSLSELPKVEEWELAAYHFSSAEVVFKVTENEVVDEMNSGTAEIRHHDGVVCIRKKFSSADKVVHLMLVCYIVRADVRKGLDKSIAEMTRKLQISSPKSKIRRLLDTSPLQPIINCHAEALRSYSSHIFRRTPHLAHSVTQHSISLKLENMIQLSNESESLKNLVRVYHPTCDHDAPHLIKKLKSVTSTNRNFVSTLNQRIVIYPPDLSHAKNLFSLNHLILFSLIILIL